MYWSIMGLFYWEELIISVKLTSHSRLISVKSPARFLEWQRELSLMFDSRNVCGTWRGRGKCLSVFVFQSRIFSHVFFPSYIQALCNTDVPNSPDTCIKLLYCRLLVVWVSGHLHGGTENLTAACVCFGNMTIFPYMFNSNKNDKARENPRAF